MPVEYSGRATPQFERISRSWNTMSHHDCPQAAAEAAELAHVEQIIVPRSSAKGSRGKQEIAVLYRSNRQED